MVSAVVQLLLLLLFSGCTTITVARGVDEVNYMVVATSSLKAKAVCEGPRVNNTSADWVPVTRPHGPCSEAAGGSEPSVADMLRWDEHRAGYIQDQLSLDDSRKKLPGKSPNDQQQLHKQGSDPTIQGKPGRPRKKKASQQSSEMPELAATGGGHGDGGQTMVLDTASVLPWLQCAPCPVPPCHPQTDTLYDPSKSSTSAIFSCNSPACRQLGPFANGCSTNNQCQYRVQYPDGSSTMGTYISDVMTLTPTRVIPKFQFGCSHAVQGSFSSKIAGTMGLGGGPQSLVSQTAKAYGNAFAYCIPPTASTTGFFLLGVPRRSSSRYVVTPMLKNKLAPTLYLVRLQAITVAGQQLNVPPTVFAGNAVMDSRTVITRLPPTAYQALRSAFRNQMSMYRTAAPKGPLDTCYDFTGVATITLPKIALVFDRNAVVELHPSGVLFSNCLAFASSADDRSTGIIGNAQQQTLEVLYNVGGRSVAFRHAAC